MRKTLFFLYPRLSEFSGISKCLGTFVLSLCRKASGVFGNMVRSAHCKVHNRVSKQVQVSWLSSLDPIEGNIYRKPGFLPAIKKGFPVDFHLIQFNSMNDPTSSFTPEIFRHVGFTQCQAVTMPNLSPFSMGEIQTSPLNGSCLWQWGFATVSFIQILVLKGCELQSWWPSDMDHMGINIYEIGSHIVDPYLQTRINNTTRKGPLKALKGGSPIISSSQFPALRRKEDKDLLGSTDAECYDPVWCPGSKRCK